MAELESLAVDATSSEIALFATGIASRGTTDVGGAAVRDAFALAASAADKVLVLARFLSALERALGTDLSPAIVSTLSARGPGQVALAAQLVDCGMLGIGPFVESVALPTPSSNAIEALCSLLDVAQPGRPSTTLNDAHRGSALMVELCSRASFDIAVRLIATLSIASSTETTDAGEALRAHIVRSTAFRAGLCATMSTSIATSLEIIRAAPPAEEAAALEKLTELLHVSEAGPWRAGVSYDLAV